MGFACQGHMKGQSECNVFQAFNKALLLAHKHMRNRNFITRPKLVVIIQNAK